MEKMNGAQALVASLVKEGVDVIFGLPGMQVAERLKAPVVNSTIGTGAIRGDHSLSMGPPHWSDDGTLRLLPKADVVLIVGSRFTPPNYVPTPLEPTQKVIQIDIDPTEIGRNQYGMGWGKQSEYCGSLNRQDTEQAQLICGFSVHGTVNYRGDKNAEKHTK